MLELDFFHCLETALEPVFSATDYAQIPQEILSILNTNNLLKDTYITEIECDKCGDDCPENNIREIKHDEHTNKYFYTCPTGYLKNPVCLTDDAVKGKQFDFNKLDELICAKSNLVIRPDLKYHFINNDMATEIGFSEISGKTVAVIFYQGLNNDNFTVRLTFVRNAINPKILIVITPSFDVLLTHEAQLLENSNTYLITLKTVFENDFNVTKIIQRKLQPENPEYQFFQQGEFWTITFKGKTIHMKPDGGYEYIQKLLEHPNKGLNSLQLEQLVHPPPEFKPNETQFDIEGDKPEDRPSLKIDSKTKKELTELQEELSDAEKDEDIGRKEKCKEKISEILSSGKITRQSNELTRAQERISKAIERVFKDIEKSHPQLHAYLKSTISMYSGFKYTPPDVINWQTTP